MSGDISWRSHLIKGAFVLVLVLIFQQITRGQLTPIVAIFVATGFVFVSELVRRLRPRFSK